MGGKNLLLFQEMLKDAKVDDRYLFHDLVNGFRLTGELKPSGQFPPKFKVAAVSVEELGGQSRLFQQHLMLAV